MLLHVKSLISFLLFFKYTSYDFRYSGRLDALRQLSENLVTSAVDLSVLESVTWEFRHEMTYLVEEAKTHWWPPQQMVRFNNVFYPTKGHQNPNESALSAVHNQRQLEFII